MPKVQSKRLRPKNNAGIATGSNKFGKAKSNANQNGNQAALDSVGKKQCVVLLKKLKLPIKEIPLRENGTQRAVAGNIKLQRCVVKLAKYKGSQSELERKAVLSSGSTVPQKNAEMFKKKCQVRIKRMEKKKHIRQVTNNSSAIELPRSTASPMLSKDFGIQLGNFINKSNTTQQNANLEPVCLQDSYMSAKSSTPLNESVRENGHAISTNLSIENDHQSPVHMLNNVNDRNPQTPVSKTEESSENFPNKSHRIAGKYGKAKSYKLTTLQKQRKFFNKKNQISKKLMNSNPKNVSSNKKKLSKNVYEFLSQSNGSDQDKAADPAADIIKQMINDGKVVVTTRVKGRLRCKPTQTRAKKVRPVGKRKQCSLIDINKNIKKKKSTENLECLMTAVPPSSPSPIMSPVYEADDNFEPQPLSDHSHTVHVTKSSKRKSNDSSMNLARSVLINESSKNNRELDINERQKLLDVARKFVSTPVNKKLSNIRGNEALNNMNLSPIVGPTKGTPQLTSSKSPWRVPDDVPLPNTFTFGRNSSDLPSFSSDYLSKSPRKQTSNNQSHMKNQSAASTSSQIPRKSDFPLFPVNNQSISIGATFQQPLNNSNAENLPPITHNASDASSDENQENDENFVHLPNPCRTIQNRSPLKKINILEVINLPSWQNKDNKVSTKEQQPTKTVDEVAKQPTTSNVQLFGFDEFLNNSSAIPLDSDDIQQQSTSKNFNNTNNYSNKTLQDLYQNLEDIGQTEDEIPKPTNEPMRFGYDEAGTRQQDLREMFCSTMINQNKTLTDGGITSQTEQNDDAGDESNSLFRDPETTFNNKQPHRTYGRPKKRVRKNRHEFIMFKDSDLSDEEEERENACDKKHKSPKRKKHRTNKENAELKEFVTSFNEMCKDVESYELIVE